MTKKMIIAAAALAFIAAAGIAAFVIMNNFSADDPSAEIYRAGKLIMTVPLDKDADFIIEDESGYNKIRVENGKICVYESDCPDKVCVNRGAINGAVPIICLPHRLEICVVNGKKDFDAQI